jgi:hypothetical protein
LCLGGGEAVALAVEVEKWRVTSDE